MNGKEHATIGLLAGPAAGFALSIKANRRPAAAEVGGWLVGGLAGAKLPDILEPAIHPRHRKFCHSGTILASDLAFLQSLTLEGWIQRFHDEAARELAKAIQDPDYGIWHSITALLLEFLAGALPAVLAGYASHLLADCTTPCSIPVC